MRHRKPKRYRGLHRASIDPRARYTVVVSTALVGAGVIAVGAGTALPQPSTDAATAAVTTQTSRQNTTATNAETSTQQQQDTRAAEVDRASRSQSRAAAPAPEKLPDWTRPAAGRISSTFGYRNFRGSEYHGGLDFAIAQGTPVRAASRGVVKLADWHGGYGKLVILDHGNGVVTYYGHNSKLLVSEGQTVEAGDVVSLSGNTGDSTGPHLHFEVRVGGERIDPQAYLREHGVDI